MGAHHDDTPVPAATDLQRDAGLVGRASRVRVVTHDVRNSFASILAFGQLLRTDPTLPEDVRRQADLLVAEAERASRLVEELAELARGVEPTPASSTAAAPAEAGTGSSSAGTGRPRILVVDDEAAIRDFLGRILRRAGYEPILAPAAGAALDVIRRDPPDAILCDNRMAGMNGTAFHDAVAAIDPGLGRRFVFMSGDVLDPELREFALDRDIVLLAKPFDIDDVGRTIARVLHEGAG